MNETIQSTAVAVNNENAQTATAVSVRDNAPRFAVPISSVQDLENIGMKYAQSGFFGKIAASQGCLVALSQREEGVSIIEWLARHQIIGNTISWKPNWMLGEFKRRGGKVHIVQSDREVCEIEFTHWDGERYTGRITMEEMKLTSVPFNGEGKLKSNWHNFPDDMLFARVCGKSLRRLCPEVFSGMYTDAEVQDFERPAPAPTAVKVSPSPIAATATEPPPPTDAHVCPCGTVKGKRWEELPTDTLVKVLETPADKAPALTDAHRNAIIDELARREAVEAETVEAEVVEK